MQLIQVDTLLRDPTIHRSIQTTLIGKRFIANGDEVAALRDKSPTLTVVPGTFEVPARRVCGALLRAGVDRTTIRNAVLRHPAYWPLFRFPLECVIDPSGAKST